MSLPILWQEAFVWFATQNSGLQILILGRLTSGIIYTVLAQTGPRNFCKNDSISTLGRDGVQIHLWLRNFTMTFSTRKRFWFASTLEHSGRGYKSAFASVEWMALPASCSSQERKSELQLALCLTTGTVWLACPIPVSICCLVRCPSIASSSHQ